MRLVLALILTGYLGAGPALAAEDESEQRSDIVILAVQKRGDDVKPIIVSVPDPAVTATTAPKDVALAVAKRNPSDGG